MRRLLEIGLIAALVVSTAGAEGVRLRPLAPVYIDAEGSSIKQPEGVGCGGSSGIIVADTGNGRLLRFALSEDSIRSVGTIVAPQLSHPIQARLASDGGILALDGKQRHIVRFSAAGQFEGLVEPSGAKGKIVPRRFALDSEDRLYILDIFSRRVLVVDRSGAVQREIAFPEDHRVLSDLTVDARGRVFVIDSVQKKIFAADGNASVLAAVEKDLVGKADFPTSIATDDAGNLYVGDQNGGSILILGPDGSFRGRQSGLGWKPGLLRYPSDLCVSESDHLFVADRANNRIQVFAIVR